MGATALFYVAAAMLVVWGVAHLVPTRGVVEGFGDLSADNRRIITMEWVNEGVTLIFLAAVVALTAWIDPGGPVALAVFWVSAAALFALAGVSLFTGFQIAFLPFRLCPVVFSTAAVLILVGAYVA